MKEFSTTVCALNRKGILLVIVDAFVHSLPNMQVHIYARNNALHVAERKCTGRLRLNRATADPVTNALTSEYMAEVQLIALQLTSPTFKIETKLQV
jgi:hypothetical protein